MDNPFSVGFGRVPQTFINRDVVVDEIIDAFTSSYVDSQCYKLTGIRGCGKTVTMTVIERYLRERDEWICVDLSSESEMMLEGMRKIYDISPFFTEFIDTELNLSKFGIGIKLCKNPPIQSLEIAFSKILEKIKSQNKRILFTIDELRRTDEAVRFIKFFQDAVRHELPMYILATGLLQDIESIENVDGLTFFRRASKKRLGPLNYTLIRKNYMEKLNVDFDTADKLTQYSGGYAFAFQTVGKYVWKDKEHRITDDVLQEIDTTLAEGSYSIIWSELSEKEKEYIKWIAKHGIESIDVDVLLTELKINHNQWSEPRRKLVEKGLIDCGERGKIRLLLPRFKEFIESEMRW